MTWKTIRNAGYIFEDNRLPQEDGMNVLATFLQEMTEEFVRSSFKYYTIVDELPFIYRERQVHSILLPAIAKVADAALAEQPVTRKIKRRSQHGRIDYWVYYRSYVFLIELKHGWHAFNSQKLRNTTNQSWQNAIKQIESISKSEADDLCNHSGKLLKLAMLITPCYQGSQDESQLLTRDKTESSKIHEFLISKLSPPPDWSCLWALHENLQKVESYTNGNEIYPCVGIMVKVEKP